MKTQDEFLNLRVSLLVEEMTKSDKKSVEKMIKKALNAQAPQNKKEIQKIVKDELKSKTTKKMVEDSVRAALSSEMRSQDNKDRIADITKLVLRKLYRELAYNYTPVIDRIKI